MFTSELKFISESPERRTDCYQVLDDDGKLIAGCNIEQVSLSKFKEFVVPFSQTACVVPLKGLI